PFLRATVLMTAGQTDAARAQLDGIAPRDAEETARRLRMLAAVGGLETGTIDPPAANAAIDALPPAQQRHHLSSLAWSTAWVDSIQRRPWRPAFAAACRGTPIGEVPVRYLVWVAFQELLAPILGLVLFGVFLLLGVP